MGFLESHCSCIGAKDTVVYESKLLPHYRNHSRDYREGLALTELVMVGREPNLIGLASVFNGLRDGDKGLAGVPDEGV